MNKKIVIIIIIFGFVVFTGAVLGFVSPNNKYLYWYQAYVLGKTCEMRGNVIDPPKGFTGRWLTYHTDLSLDSEIDYVNGKLTGRWTRHVKKTGIVWWSAEYIDNNSSGDWAWFDKITGKVESQSQSFGTHEPLGEWRPMLFWHEL